MATFTKQSTKAQEIIRKNIQQNTIIKELDDLFNFLDEELDVPYIVTTNRKIQHIKSLIKSL